MHFILHLISCLFIFSSLSTIPWSLSWALTALLNLVSVPYLMSTVLSPLFMCNDPCSVSLLQSNCKSVHRLSMCTWIILCLSGCDNPSLLENPWDYFLNCMAEVMWIQPCYFKLVLFPIDLMIFQCSGLWIDSTLACTDVQGLQPTMSASVDVLYHSQWTNAF